MVLNMIQHKKLKQNIKIFRKITQKLNIIGAVREGSQDQEGCKSFSFQITANDGRIVKNGSQNVDSVNKQYKFPEE